MDINREMEMMFGDEFAGVADEKPAAKKKKQGGKKKVTIPTESYGVISSCMLLPESMLLNQIQAAQLSETLIDELKQVESANKGQVDELN